jgi:hypothetical protein
MVIITSLILSGVWTGNNTDNTVHAQTSASVPVRFVHALPVSGSADIYVDGQLIVADVSFGDATPHLSFPIGDYEVALRQAGSDPTSPAILSQLVTFNPFEAGWGETLVIQPGTDSIAEISVNGDDLNAGELGQARLHVIHAAAGAGTVDLIGTNFAPILQGIAFNVASGATDLPVSTWDLLVVPSGDEEDIVAQIGQINFNTNMLYTLVVAGEPSNVRVLRLETPLSADVSSDSVLTSIGHGSSDIGAVDIYVGDIWIVAGLVPGDITQHVALPSGDLTLTIRDAGTPPNSEGIATSNTSLTSATGAASLIVIGSAVDGSLTFSIYEDDIANLTSDIARVRVINSISLSPATVSFSNGTQVADTLGAFSASDPVDIEVGTYNAIATIEIGGEPLQLSLTALDLVGGTYNTLLVFINAEAGITPVATAINTGPSSLPGSSSESPVVADTSVETDSTDATDTDTAAPSTDTTDTTTTDTTTSDTAASTDDAGTTDTTASTPDAVPAATEAPAAVAGQPPVSPPIQQLDQVLRGTINLNQGVNLHCREYPSPEAFSMGLIPDGTTMEIRGYAGPADPEVVTPFIPVAEGTFDDPTSATAWEEIWTSAYWETPDGGVIDCWVRADFLVLNYRNKLVDEVDEFFALEELETIFPVIEPIPYNYPAEAVDTIITPPTPTLTDPTATISLDSGVSLHLRRLPDITSQSLALIPNGTSVIVIEQTEVTVDAGVGQPDTPVWLYVELDNGNGTYTTGWVSLQYVELSQGGRALELEDIPEADVVLPGEENLTTSVSIATGGSTSSPSAATSVPSTNGTGSSGTILGTVDIPQGANLNMYDQPSVNGSLVRSLSAGTSVTVLGRNSDASWLNVRYDAVGEGSWTGWVSNSSPFVSINVDVNSLPVTG